MMPISAEERCDIARALREVATGEEEVDARILMGELGICTDEVTRVGRTTWVEADAVKYLADLIDRTKCVLVAVDPRHWECSLCHVLVAREGVMGCGVAAPPSFCPNCGSWVVHG